MKSALSEACTIKIDKFEGPFDLLFYLFEKNKIDIYDIPINEITDQYMGYLFNMNKLDLDIASEFLVTASTLLHIKSRMLLPKDEKEEKKDEEEGKDPRDELVFKLIEYKKYKKVANILKERKNEWEKIYYKQPEDFEFTYERRLINMSPIMLSDAYFDILKKNRKKLNAGAKKIHHILKREKVSMKVIMKEIAGFFASRISLIFSDIFPKAKRTRLEIVTGFLAILELAKMKKVEIRQNDLYSDIQIYKKTDDILDFEDVEDIDIVDEEIYY